MSERGAREPDEAPFFTHVPRDRWAHRRGEPRTFALAWTLYLFVATLLTLLGLGFAGPVWMDSYRPAAQVLLSLVGLGIVLGWPMTRLSQAPPSRPMLATLQDLVVIYLPSQAVLWPQWLLARWPLEVVAAVAVLLLAWSVVVGGLLSIALGDLRRLERGGRGAAGAPMVWMVVFVAVGLGGSVGLMFAGGGAGWGTGWGAGFRPAMMLSVPTAVYELTRARHGAVMSAAVWPGHWLMIAGTGGLGVLLWVLASLAGWRGVAKGARSG